MPKEFKSKVKCPKCNSAHFFAVSRYDIGLELFSIGPKGEIVPTAGSKPFQLDKIIFLYCDNCNWEGTAQEYFEEKSGIIRIFTGEKNAFEN